MKLKDVEVGGFYLARVSGKGTVVEVLSIDKSRGRKCIALRNVLTGKPLSNRTAAFLRGKVVKSSTGKWKVLKKDDELLTKEEKQKDPISKAIIASARSDNGRASVDMTYEEWMSQFSDSSIEEAELQARTSELLALMEKVGEMKKLPEPETEEDALPCTGGVRGCSNVARYSIGDETFCYECWDEDVWVPSDSVKDDPLCTFCEEKPASGDCGHCGVDVCEDCHSKNACCDGNKN